VDAVVLTALTLLGMFSPNELRSARRAWRPRLPCLLPSKRDNRRTAFRPAVVSSAANYQRPEDPVMRTRISVSVIALLAVALGGIAAARTGPQAPSAAVEPKAEQTLKAMSAYLAGLRTFTFQVEEFFDDVHEDGLKVQLSNQRHIAVSRPDKLYGDNEGDTADSRFFYDGKTVTVLDRGHKTYATVKVPGTIDAMLDDLHERFGMEQPMADFILSNPYKAFMDHVQSGTYAGLHHVGKVKCHHLAFRQKVLDWQIWIETGAQPLPRKLVIRFKRQVDQPEYMAIIHRWDTSPKLTAETFRAEPPAGYRKVDFLHRHDPDPAKKPGN
jgi:hypothetical protein